jgi:hypothetical protein
VLTLDSYGFLGNTSSAYYTRGRAGNLAKFSNSGAIVEMGFLMGLTFAPPLGSNLRKRMVNAYTNVQSANRFSDLLGGTFQVVPSITGQRMNVSPLDLIWTVYH